ncbi:hypothetical protein HNQ56_002737 [Anaerotaenia torta]
MRGDTFLIAGQTVTEEVIKRANEEGITNDNYKDKR